MWETEPTWYRVTESCFVIVFFLEILLKSFVYGLVIGEGTYLKNWWNVLDAVVVLSSVITLLTELLSTGTDALDWLQSFRLIRALRPLRAIAQVRVQTTTQSPKRWHLQGPKVWDLHGY